MARSTSQGKRRIDSSAAAKPASVPPPRYAAPAVGLTAIPGMVWPALPEPGGADVLALRYQLERTQWWPEERLRTAQFEQLRVLLDHAIATVPYYRQSLSQAGYHPGQPLTPETWAALPFLTRQDIQTAGPGIHSERVPESHGDHWTKSTSGSTGTPVVAKKSMLGQKLYETAGLTEALWHRRDFSGKLGIIRSVRVGGVRRDEAMTFDTWGAPFAGLYRTGPLVTCDIFAEPAEQVRWLIAEKPDYLLSMPSNLRAVAHHAVHHGIKLPPLREVRSYGEAFDADFPKMCRDVWSARHTSIYSTEEVGIVALQCPKRPHFHVRSELILAEVLDDAGRPCAPGEIGQVVLTPLHGFAMPLIRYRIGDLAEVGAPCECGRGLPVWKRILGRTRNVLTLPSGEKRYFGSVGGVFGQIAAIIQHQIIQKSRDEIDLHVVSRRSLSADEEARLLATLAKKIGDGFRFRLIRVDSIPRNREGKYEDFRSEIGAA